MSQKRHEKVLRRKVKMDRRGKQLREARRQQRIVDRRSDLEAVFGPLLPGQVVDPESVNHLSPEERARMDRIRKKFEGLAWNGPDRTVREQRKSSRKADMETVYSSLLAGVKEGDTAERLHMKWKLNSLYGKAGEAG
jgi:hypothetical protein